MKAKNRRLTISQEFTKWMIFPTLVDVNLYTLNCFKTPGLGRKLCLIVQRGEVFTAGKTKNSKVKITIKMLYPAKQTFRWTSLLRLSKIAVKASSKMKE